MDKKELQKRFLHLIMIVFFILMIFYFPKLNNLEDYFIYFATVLFSLHFWYGAIFFINTLGVSDNILKYIIDFVIIVVKLYSVYTIVNMPLWFIVNGVIMGLGIIKYHLASKNKHSKKKHSYISKKIFVELISVSGFFILAFFTWFIKLDVFLITISAIVFGIQLPFLYWMFFKEKVYKKVT